MSALETHGTVEKLRSARPMKTGAVAAARHQFESVLGEAVVAQFDELEATAEVKTEAGAALVTPSSTKVGAPRPRKAVAKKTAKVKAEPKQEIKKEIVRAPRKAVAKKTAKVKVELKEVKEEMAEELESTTVLQMKVASASEEPVTSDPVPHGKRRIARMGLADGLLEAVAAGFSGSGLSKRPKVLLVD